MINSAATARTALICGASGGLGQILAGTLQAHGMQVFGTMRKPPEDPSTFEFPMLAMDVGSDESVEACIAAVIEKVGRIDVVVNCVNEMVLGSVLETSMEELSRVYDINVVGAARVYRAAFQAMQKQNSGLIVTMSSLGGIIPVPLLSAYTSSKFAIEAFSEALYHEAKPFNVNVVIMQPVAMHMDRPDTGDHLKVSSGVGESSITHRMVRRMAKDTAASKLTPEIVSEEIYKVITSDKRKLRYPLDRAKIIGRIRRYGPQSMIDKLVGGAVGGKS